SLNLVLRSALARVSKDGHKRDRASGHPSRRRFAPPQDEVCGLKLDPPIRLVSWNRSTRTYCPATGGYSAAHIEEEVVVTDKGCRMISLFPAKELPIANAY
ncbi:MAG: hypothetical protein WAN75_38690, partial [Xanthobacteraceae bacterium]